MDSQNDYRPAERRGPGLLTSLMILVVVAALALGGGFWLGRGYGMANAPSIQTSSTNPQPIGGQPIGTSKPEDLEKQFQTFWEVWDLVGEEFYHTEPLDQQKMVYGAIRGMLQSLGDDFTGFQEPEAAERSREDMRGEFDGIGAYVEFKDGQVLIQSPIEDTPASRADVRAGDVVIAVDDHLMSDVTANLARDEAIQAAVKLIRGPKGTTVKLRLFRPDTKEELTKEIVRDAIPLISVRSTMIGDIAYIHLSEFKQTSADELDKAMAKLKAQNPKALIFDMRNNPGGFVKTAQNVLGRFVEEGATHYQEDSDGEQEEYLVARDGDNVQTLYDLPMVVLVNGGSASASEIVSGAFQDNGRAKLLGEKTFGKGSVQSVHKITNDNSEARITIAHWLTPKKRAIHKVGVTPEYVVPFSDDASQYPVECLLSQRPPEGQETCADSQLFWALKILRDEGTPPPPPATTPTPTPGR